MEDARNEALIRKSIAGDMAAFKELVVKYEGKVAGVVRSMLGATQEAEDVGQEVFIRFYDSLSKFRGDAPVSTYLVRIAINLSLNELKRRKKSGMRSVSLDYASGIPAQAEMVDLGEQLRYEFAHLEPEFQAVATLRLIEGYSTQETADLLGIPVGTVLSRLARAQHKLRTALLTRLK